MKRRLDPEDHKPSLRDKIIGLGERSIRKSYFPQIQQQLEALRRMNRELRAISNCNQTLMRAEDEQTLLNEVCRIVCDAAGYRMAWVGYAEHDEGKTVRPVAWAGVEDGYLAAADITWADTERGRGPTETAIRTGASSCFQDFATDSQIAPWRENALQRGYRSVLGLPLMDEEANTFGALTIYSTAPNAFPAEEVRLLEELAGDLAFGITVLRGRIERQQAVEALRESEQRLSALIDFLPDATLAIDTDKRIIIWNRAMEEMTGIPAQQMIGKGDYAYTMPFYGVARPQLMDILWLPEHEVATKYPILRAKGDHLVIEVFCPALKGGEGAFVWAKAAPLRDSEGRMIGAIECIRDITERKQAEESLRDSEKRLSQIIDFLPDATFTIDLKGTITTWNRNAEEFTGVKAGDMLGKGDYECAVPFYGERRPLLIDLVLHPSEEIEKRYPYIKREGGTVIGEAYTRSVKRGEAYLFGIAAPLYDSEGKVIGAIESIRDITGRKQAEEALRESEELHRLTLSNISDAVFITDDAGSFKYICPNVDVIFGYSFQEVQAMGNILDLLGDNLFSLSELEALRELNNIERDITDKSGRVHSLLVNVKRISIKGGTLLYVCREITERKRAEAALRESENRLNAIVRGSPIPQFVIDSNHQVTHWNDALEKYTGIKAEDIIGTNRQWLAFYPNERPCMADLLVDGAIEAIPVWYEGKYATSSFLEGAYEAADFFPYFGQSGTWLYFTAAPIRDTDGRIIGAVETLADITERKRAEEAMARLNAGLEQRVKDRTADLRQASDELEESQRALMNLVEDLNERTLELEATNEKLKDLDQLKSLFIASMSHELRTPLNSIIGFSSILLNEWTGPLTAEQKENLMAVLRSGKHLLALINDVIDVTKIEARKVEVAAEDFDLHDVVTEVATVMSNDIRNKGLELTVQADHIRLHTDRRRLLQCLLNLASNAVKFTERGAVSLCAGLGGDRRTVEIAVRDTGIGMRAEDLGKLFLPFVRLDSPLRSKVLGTGLGLYLTRKLLTEVLKGQVFVSSVPGEGSQFLLRVPLSIEGSKL